MKITYKPKDTTMARRSLIETSVTDRNAERRLVSLQRKIAAANGKIMADRNALLDEMNRKGYTQARLAGLLNEANVAEDMPSITDDAVYKALTKVRS
jgi:hypothetical protein